MRTQLHPAKLRVLVGLLGVLCARTAVAGDRTCALMTIEADADVRRRWPELPEHVRQVFDARDDIDACARMRFVMSGPLVTLEVLLPDGRSASRSVSRREDVVPTLEALLLVPRHESLPATAAPEPSESPVPSVSANPAPPHDAGASADGPWNAPSGRPAGADRVAMLHSSEHPPSHLRIELSAITGVRVGDGQTAVGLGALSFLDIDGWLAGFEGRADRYQMRDGGASGAALELAALCGRRFRFRTLALDLVAGPAAALQGTTTYQTQTSSRSTSSVAPRLVLGSRVHFGALSTLRTFIGIDGEIGPARAPGSDADVPGAPQLPLWTLGLALGATVGTR